jgi:hypothetical protein
VNGNRRLLWVCDRFQGNQKQNKKLFTVTDVSAGSYRPIDDGGQYTYISAPVRSITGRRHTAELNDAERREEENRRAEGLGAH